MKTLLRGFLLSVALACAAPTLATVPSNVSRNDYVASGSPGAGGTAFAFTFATADKAWVQVLVNGVTATSGYTTSLNVNQAVSPGGTVTFLAAPTASAAVRIQRVVPYTQTVHYQPYSAFPAATHEAALDKMAMGLQQVDRDRSDLAADQAVRWSSQATRDAGQDSTISSNYSELRAAIGAGGGGGGAIGDGSTVLATGTTTARALKDRFIDHTFNVKDFGAKGNGVADDTVAIQAAINAACDDSLSAPGDWRQWKGHGGVVFLPTGVYRTTDTLKVYIGNVGIQGAGQWTSAIFLDTVGTSKDIVSFFRQSAPAGKTTSTAGGAGGFIRDLFLGTVTPFTGRNGVTVDTWGQFTMKDVWIQAVGGTGVWIGNLVGGTFDTVMVHQANGAGLRVGLGSAPWSDYSTVLAFTGFHVADSVGPGADLAQCFDCTFTNSIFEGIGQRGCTDPATCPGVAVGQGEFTFLHPYFEGNKSWDMDVAALSYPTQSPTVGIYNYTGRSQPTQKLGAAALWHNNLAYNIGDYAVAGGNRYQATTGGTSSATLNGPRGTGTGIVDGTVVWSYVGSSAGGVILGPLINGGGMYGGWWLDTAPPVRIKLGARNFPFLGLHMPITENSVVYDTYGLTSYNGLVLGSDQNDVRVAYGLPTNSNFAKVGFSTIASISAAQGAPPGSCVVGDVVLNSTGDGNAPTAWSCLAPNTWVPWSTFNTVSYKHAYTYDVGSLAAGACDSHAVTATGAVRADSCVVGVNATMPDTLQVDCSITAVDTATVRVCNRSGGSVDPPPADYSVKVLKF